MLKRPKKLIIAAIIMGTIMSASHAKPDLTTPVDMSVLHAKDSGYRFVHHTFIFCSIVA